MEVHSRKKIQTSRKLQLQHTYKPDEKLFENCEKQHGDLFWAVVFDFCQKSVQAWQAHNGQHNMRTCIQWHSKPWTLSLFGLPPTSPTTARVFIFSRELQRTSAICSFYFRILFLRFLGLKTFEMKIEKKKRLNRWGRRSIYIVTDKV